MRRLKAQLMGMFSGKSQMPLDSPYLPDSATYKDGLSTVRMSTAKGNCPCVECNDPSLVIELSTTTPASLSCHFELNTLGRLVASLRLDFVICH